MTATTLYEIKRERMPMFGERFIVYVDGQRRHNCSSKARAEDVVREIKAKRGEA